MRRRVARAVATVTVLTTGMVVAAAAPALAAEEFRYFTTLNPLNHTADYKIIFYGAPYGQVRKHLVIADKEADGVAPRIRIWPAPVEDPCNYIDYADKKGTADGAAHYDIYYPVGMIAYVLGSREAAWGGQYEFNSSAVINAC
ncbi:hypothetical protein [Actinoplanes aureus]|uniref:Uncharacterized protein n=1 Tax=Actinoplanes aureus TaxID=2792083 RepID=A0A931C5N5_9ACTN|nr:hypothetical protein [Actinoplanes aureus]MBG0563859.1 hypothetical protein [Actinoplanes aureus]